MTRMSSTRLIIGGLCWAGLLTAAPAAAQLVPPLVPQIPSDVVIIALGSLDTSSELRTLRLAGALAGERIATGTVRDVQMELVSKTASFGPVLVLVPDEQTRGAFHDNCDAYVLCEAIASGRVRTAIVPHDTVWIRDYGPLLEVGPGGQVFATESAYYDVRKDIARANELQRVTRRRRLLVEQAIVGGIEAGEDQRDLRSQFELWREYSDVLEDEAAQGQRLQDDRAPFAIAQAVLAESVHRQSSFAVRSTPVHVDGGNLLKLDDAATCFTTRDLFSRNRGKESALIADLKDAYRCQTTHYLESLPGPVIEHVDMFLLPVRGKTLLLADYGLHLPHIKRAWPRMSAVERELTFQASLAMDRNEAALRASGFDVVLVPALPPRKSDSGDIFYPTLLNALVRSDGAGGAQVLVPTYAGSHADVQEEALKAIRAAFGARAEVVAIEATAAAEAQGAVHCLTITAPFTASVFKSGLDVRQRQIWALREALNESLIRVTRPLLQGRWTARSQADNDRLDIELRFDDDRVRIVAAGVSTDAAFVVTKDPSYKWPIEVSLDQGRRKASGRIDWLTDQSFRLVLSGIDTFVVVKTLTPEDLDAGERRIESARVDSTLGDADSTDEAGLPMQAWSLAGEAGRTVTVSVETEDFDPELFVFGPGLEAPIHDDDSGDRLNARAVVRFPQSGIYRVVVRGVDPWSAGAFALRVDEGGLPDPAGDGPPAGALTIGRTVEGELAAGTGGGVNGPAQVWTLSGCGGRTVRLDVASEEFDTFLSVIGEDLADPLTNDDVDGSLDSALELPCRERVTYRIIVTSALGNESGRYSIRAAFVER